MDINFCRRLVMQRLPCPRETIGPRFWQPRVRPISTGLREIYQFEIKGDSYFLMDRRTTLDWDIAFKLRSVPGVVNVNTYGGELQTYQVQLDAAKLVSYQIRSSKCSGRWNKATPTPVEGISNMSKSNI